MSNLSSQRPLFTTREFDRWWEGQGQVISVQATLDPAAAKLLAWEAWRKGREQMSEATAFQRLQPARG